MPILLDRHPDLIEQHREKNEWRLKTHAPETRDDNPQDVVLEPLAINALHHGDGLELMKRIPDKSVNLVLCDPPYGTAGGKSKSGKNIDVPLDQAALWREYERIITPNGVIVLFASDVFTNTVINAAPVGWFKYRNVWRKDNATGDVRAANQPIKDFEDIIVFSPAKIGPARDPNGPPKRGTTLNRMTYNAWTATLELVVNGKPRTRDKSLRNVKRYKEGTKYWRRKGCPRAVIECAKEHGTNECGGEIHPYQKPQFVLNDLIRRYSNAGEIVLDNCVGSGSTAVAAINADRQWIAIEKDDVWFERAGARINAVLANKAALGA